MSEGAWSDRATLERHLKPLQGYGFRVIPGASVIRNADFDHLWAGKGNGRFNSEKTPRIYLALDEHTARAEFDHYQVQAGLDPRLAEKHMYAVKLTLKRVLFLTHKAVREAVGVEIDELVEEWDGVISATKTQLIGNAIAGGAGTAIVFPSARRKNGRNIVVFRDRVMPGESVEPVSMKTTSRWS